jgi:hypothetical protein
MSEQAYGDGAGVWGWQSPHSNVGEECELSFTGFARGSDNLSRHHGDGHGRVEAHHSPRLSERPGASGKNRR